jgi:hypothetical protein
MEKKQSSISIQTLTISALAAAAAAVIVPMIWERGTLVATALTPVIVALVSEALSKPAEAIGSVAPKVTRRSSGIPVHSPHSADRFDPLPPEERAVEPPPREDDPFGLRQARRPVRRHWRLALATGVAAFVIAVVTVTASELVFGGPATRSDGRTTFFSGRGSTEETPTATPSATPSATAEATPQAETPTPTATPTVTAAPTATPQPLQEPAPPAPTPTPTPAP